MIFFSYGLKKELLVPFQVVYPFSICGPVNSEVSMSNRIRLSKFRFTLQTSPHVCLSLRRANQITHITCAERRNTA